jgi:heme/copper-type cytochrome/quinol oxidase subunit 2
MSEERATDAAATQYPAPDQEAQNPAMIFIFALVLILILVLAFVLVFLASLAQEVSKQQAADATATQQAARDQEFQEAMLLVIPLLPLFAKFVAFLSTTALTQQARKKQASHAPTA